MCVCVAIFAEYSRIEDWKSGHRKLNSLLETFSIQDTIFDIVLLKTNFRYQDSLILTNILLKGLVLARRSNKYTAQYYIISAVLLLSLFASSSC